MGHFENAIICPMISFGKCYCSLGPQLLAVLVNSKTFAGDPFALGGKYVSAGSSVRSFKLEHTHLRISRSSLLLPITLLHVLWLEICPDPLFEDC